MSATVPTGLDVETPDVLGDDAGCFASPRTTLSPVTSSRSAAHCAGCGRPTASSSSSSAAVTSWAAARAAWRRANRLSSPARRSGCREPRSCSARCAAAWRATGRSSRPGASAPTRSRRSARRWAARDAAPVLPACDRQPRGARHAGHPRRARAQRPPARADTRHHTVAEPERDDAYRLGAVDVELAHGVDGPAWRAPRG